MTDDTDHDNRPHAQYGTDEYEALRLPATARIMATLLNACIQK